MVIQRDDAPGDPASEQKYMKSPMEITVGKMNTANKNIDHQYL